MPANSPAPPMRFLAPYHAEITYKAAGDLLRADRLAWVAGANMAQDASPEKSRLHFDNCCFREGARYIAAQWHTIEAEKDPYSATALDSLGRLLHAVQDFYAHSNWVELHTDEKPFRLWDFHVESLPPRLISGVWPTGQPKKCQEPALPHEQVNKDRPGTEAGRQPIPSGPYQGKTFYWLAKHAATLATREQVKRFVARAEPAPSAAAPKPQPKPGGTGKGMRGRGMGKGMKMDKGMGTKE